jgi:hypothetical protein
MLGKNGIFCGKSFEKLFFQEIPRKTFRGHKMYGVDFSYIFFPGKILGKIPRENSPKKCWEKWNFPWKKF